MQIKNDTEFLKIIKNNKNLDVINRVTSKFLSDNPYIKEYLDNRYNDSESYKETLYRIKNNIEIRPCCIECGGHVSFVGTYVKKNTTLQNGYARFCSQKCSSKNINTIRKSNNTCIERYGTKSCMQNNDVKKKRKETLLKRYNTLRPGLEKLKETCLKRYGVDSYSKTNEFKEKYKQTCLEIYGVEYYTQTKQFIEKRKETTLEKYNAIYYSSTNEFKEKYKQTCLERYGVEYYTQTSEYKERIIKLCNKLYDVDYYFQTNNFKNKSASTKLILYNDIFYNNKEKTFNTCLEKYGVDSYSKTNEFKEKYKHTCLEKYHTDSYFKTKEFQIKQYQTKKKNNSFNKSKSEDKLYEILSNKYGKENIIRQYRSEDYPFVCDFYIKTTNTYVEYNGNWTHGKHPFDNTNPDDLKTLRLWKDKSTEINFKGVQKKYYENAIYTWTDLDVRKRKIAKENNLNFIEIFDINNINL